MRAALRLSMLGLCATSMTPLLAQAGSNATGMGSGIYAVPETTPPPAAALTPGPSPSLPLTTPGGVIVPAPNPPITPPSVPGTPGSSAAGGTSAVASPLPPAPDGPAVSTGPAAPGGLRRDIAGPLLPAGRVADGKLDLVSAFDLGRENDATYRAAMAEREANRQLADQSLAGYLPSANYSYQNIPTESGSRHVATLTQPIISLGGLATIKQRGPRRRYANATFEVREQDLSVRLMTAVVEIIRATEASKLNDAKIAAFREQSERAERLYSNGLGTITDARDISVRYEQALANRILLKSDQIAAAARLGSITGQEVPGDAFALPHQFGTIDLIEISAYLAQQGAENPQIEAARENERISKLEADRIRGSMLPTVGASATFTRRTGVNDFFVGMSVNAPLNAGSFFQAGAASATKQRAFEERRQVEERARTELSRLYALVDGGQQALVINAKAIEAAKLSVEANTKSYEGGVRSNVDVVNAIQVQFEVQNAYVQAATTVATNYLNLLLLAGQDPEDALRDTQRFLLDR